MIFYNLPNTIGLKFHRQNYKGETMFIASQGMYWFVHFQHKWKCLNPTLIGLRVKCVSLNCTWLKFSFRRTLLIMSMQLFIFPSFLFMTIWNWYPLPLRRFEVLGEYLIKLQLLNAVQDFTKIPENHSVLNEIRIKVGPMILEFIHIIISFQASFHDLSRIGILFTSLFCIKIVLYLCNCSLLGPIYLTALVLSGP